MCARKLSIFLLLVLAACRSLPENIEPLPTVVIWEAQHTPALSWIGPFFNECARSRPDIGLIVHERSAPFLDIEESDFVFRWGAPAQITTPAFTMGWDVLSFIVHPENTLPSLNMDEIRSIYLGNVDRWSELDAGTPLSGNIQAWGYAQGADIQMVFEAQMGGQVNNPAIQLAPDVSAMVQAIGSSPNAIGYVPVRWVNDEINILLIDDMSNISEIPILVLTPSQPQGAQEEWLLCLVDQINQ